jgi:hypothetical protein
MALGVTYQNLSVGDVDVISGIDDCTILQCRVVVFSL